MMTISRVPAGYYRAEGISKNFNTIEEYQTADKALILQQAGRKVGLQGKPGSKVSANFLSL